MTLPMTRHLRPALLCCAMGCVATSPGAQTVQTGRGPATSDAAPAALPRGLAAIQAPGGRVLQRPEDAVTSPTVVAPRGRIVGTPSGALVIEDPLAAAPVTAPVTVPITPAGSGLRAVTRTDPATGQRWLEIPGVAEAPASPQRSGLRVIELATPEEAARALADPEPQVIYRLAPQRRQPPPKPARQS